MLATSARPSAPEKIEIFKVRCPMNCAAADFAVTEGVSIHPGTSSICAAAEVDGVTSASGDSHLSKNALACDHAFHLRWSPGGHGGRPNS